jgi:hypothetical protein
MTLAPEAFERLVAQRKLADPATLTFEVNHQPAVTARNRLAIASLDQIPAASAIFGMFRQIEITIDANTWPKPPAKLIFPSTFHHGLQSVAISIPRLLLTIGILTTPTNPIGPTLSQYWAYIRYLAAITVGSELRITQAFASLDSHQKTILSDDFGMGLPMMWLFQTLNAVTFCDGQYFIKTLAAAASATAPKKSARGPNKSPDFVICDAAGLWHVVECKGTQSGPAYRDRQLGSGRPLATGGVAQKRSIVLATMTNISTERVDYWAASRFLGSEKASKMWGGADADQDERLEIEVRDEPSESLGSGQDLYKSPKPRR